MPYVRKPSLPRPVPRSARPRFELDERTCPTCGTPFLPVRPTGGFAGGTARVISDKWYCSYRCAKRATNVARFRPRVHTLPSSGTPCATYACSNCSAAVNDIAPQHTIERKVGERTSSSVGGLCTACAITARVRRALRRRARNARKVERIRARLAAVKVLMAAPARLEG